MIRHLHLIAGVFLILSSGTAYSEAVVITSSVIDIYGDGRSEKVSLIMGAGRKYRDEEPWCGKGEKYEGIFAIEVAFPDGRKFITFPWEESKFFYSGPWTIHFTDYNRDGVMDFNLGQYAGCNGSEYTLFSFTPEGKVVPIGRAFLEGHENSTREIELTDDGYAARCYNNVTGRRMKLFYKWDPALKEFAPYRLVNE